MLPGGSSALTSGGHGCARAACAGTSGSSSLLEKSSSFEEEQPVLLRDRNPQGSGHQFCMHCCTPSKCRASECGGIALAGVTSTSGGRAQTCRPSRSGTGWTSSLAWTLAWTTTRSPSCATPMSSTSSSVTWHSRVRPQSPVASLLQRPGHCLIDMLLKQNT